MLGRELRELRQAAELTQEQLAFRAGVDRTYVSILERGLQSPTVDTLFRLCAVLGIKPSALLARVESSYRPKKRKARRQSGKRK